MVPQDRHLVRELGRLSSLLQHETVICREHEALGSKGFTVPEGRWMIAQGCSEAAKAAQRNPGIQRNRLQPRQGRRKPWRAYLARDTPLFQIEPLQGPRTRFSLFGRSP